MKTLVVQGPALGKDALDAFKVVCMPERIMLTEAAARCVGVADDLETRKAARALADYWKLDIAFVDPAWRLSDFRLLAMDMDSTLINIESLDEVAAYAGKGAEVAAITEAAMRGEIKDYASSLRQRVALLAGVDASFLQRVLDEKLKLNAGAEQLVAGCKAAGLKILLVTGGFSFFTQQMRARLALDFTRSNELEVIDGKLSGNVSGPAGGAILDADGKAAAVREVCAEIGCPTALTIAIGDGANDLAMMKLAGLSIAYRAKPVVQLQAQQSINHASLSAVLQFFN